MPVAAIEASTIGLQTREVKILLAYKPKRVERHLKHGQTIADDAIEHQYFAKEVPQRR
jgi:hypothetical protein